MRWDWGVSVVIVGGLPTGAGQVDVLGDGLGKMVAGLMSTKRAAMRTALDMALLDAPWQMRQMPLSLGEAARRRTRRSRRGVGEALEGIERQDGADLARCPGVTFEQAAERRGQTPACLTTTPAQSRRAPPRPRRLVNRSRLDVADEIERA